jgi:hypothetical protein
MWPFKRKHESPQEIAAEERSDEQGSGTPPGADEKT